MIEETQLYDFLSSRARLKIVEVENSNQYKVPSIMSIITVHFCQAEPTLGLLLALSTMLEDYVKPVASIRP